MHFPKALAFTLPSLFLACAPGSGAPAASPASAPPASASPAPASATAEPAASAAVPAAATAAPAAGGAAASTEPAAPEGFAVFTANELKAFGKALAAKMNDKKSASESLGKYGNHSALVGHREGPGEVEYHETMADFFVVQEGEARLVVGGTMENAATRSPGEIRGTAITGGITRNLKPGDIVHIPPKVPHQLLLSPGSQFTYFVVKVESPKP
jgi:mannose-6-phosphate isomerase-like protein (cupin superfamily)